MKKLLKWILDSMPYIRGLKREIALLSPYKTAYPPGHFYSPIVSPEELGPQVGALFGDPPSSLPGLDLLEDSQLRLLSQLAELYPTIPFTHEKSDRLRYYFNNGFYSYSDAIFLHLLMRHLKPARVIEVGSGFSSAVLIDTNEHFLDNSVKLSFIEPYPARLFSLLSATDRSSHTVLVKKLQEVELEIFEQLQCGDFLFIDSTHVSKTGSDVNRILFDILPRLKSGVLIHFHDIFYPFEYPKEWVLGWKGFGWNEDYILRAFLMYNDRFEVVLMNTYMEHFHRPWFAVNMPNCLKTPGGSLWLRKR